MNVNLWPAELNVQLNRKTMIEMSSGVFTVMACSIDLVLNVLSVYGLLSSSGLRYKRTIVASFRMWKWDFRRLLVNWWNILYMFMCVYPFVCMSLCLCVCVSICMFVRMCVSMWGWRSNADDIKWIQWCFACALDINSIWMIL